MPNRGRNRRGGRAGRGCRARQPSTTSSSTSSSSESSTSEPPAPTRTGRGRGGINNTSTRGARGGRHTHRGTKCPHATAQGHKQSPATSSASRALSAVSGHNPSKINYLQRQNTQFRRKLWQVWEVWARNVGMMAAGSGGEGEDAMEWQPEAEHIIPVEFRRESQMQRMLVTAYLDGFQHGVHHARVVQMQQHQHQLQQQAAAAAASSYRALTPSSPSHQSAYYRPAAVREYLKMKGPREQPAEAQNQQSDSGPLSSSPVPVSPVQYLPIPTTM